MLHRSPRFLSALAPCFAVVTVAGSAHAQTYVAPAPYGQPQGGYAADPSGQPYGGANVQVQVQAQPPVQPQYVDQNGQPVDQNGQPLDPNAQGQAQGQPYIDENGQQYADPNAQGQYVDPNAQAQGAYGNADEDVYGSPEVAAPFESQLSTYGAWFDDPTYGRIWQPSNAIVGSDFQPYATNGSWVESEYGSTWVSDYPWGWAPFHYGRWVTLANRGWCWVPGRTWGPAWVSWRTTPGYVGWAPMAPRRVSAGYVAPWRFAGQGSFYGRPTYVPPAVVGGLYARSAPIAAPRFGAPVVPLARIAPTAMPRQLFAPRVGVVQGGRAWGSPMAAPMYQRPYAAPRVGYTGSPVYNGGYHGGAVVAPRVYNGGGFQGGGYRGGFVGGGFHGGGGFQGGGGGGFRGGFVGGGFHGGGGGRRR